MALVTRTIVSYSAARRRPGIPARRRRRRLRNPTDEWSSLVVAGHAGIFLWFTGSDAFVLSEQQKKKKKISYRPKRSVYVGAHPL